MKIVRNLIALALLSTLIYQPSISLAQGTAFTYQGRLASGTNFAQGSYDFTFALFSASSGAGQLSLTRTNTANAVTNGLFTATLDFGANFPGADRWLEIGVRTNGSGAFSTLSPRQKLTPASYAITASNLSGTLPAAQLSGAILSAQLSGAYGNSLTLNNTANSFSGNGTGLTNVNAATLNGLGSGSFWKANGNAGANPTNGAFLGTMDNLPLEFRVNGQRALRLEPGASSPNVIGGYVGNVVSNVFGGVTIAGGGSSGFENRVGSGSHYATLGGGKGNTIQDDADSSTISGGNFNQIQSLAQWSTIGGGFFNIIAPVARRSTIGGGENNAIQGNAPDSTIGGGQSNLIQTNAYQSTIGGGLQNAIQTNAFQSTIGGGRKNVIQTNADSSSIGGGGNNVIEANAEGSTIGGGIDNTNSRSYATVGGGLQNTASFAATVSGGLFNSASIRLATVGGGQNNTASGDSGAVGGGQLNSASGAASTVAGGFENTASGTGAFVGGGGYDDFVAFGNTASGLASTVVGGLANTASGKYAAVPGGDQNVAGTNSFAAGHRAKATHTGSFVWADSTDADFATTAPNQFLIRASGGVGIATTNPARSFQVGDETVRGSEGMIRLGSRTPSLNVVARKWEIGVPQTGDDAGGQGYSFVIRDADNLTTNAPFIVRYDTHYVGIGTNNPVSALHVVGTVTATAFNPSSDRNLKENFAPVSPREVLDRVAAMPISRWNFKGDAATPHIGPMAQDFHAAFGVGTDDKHIATVDADGVALAAIQGLNQKLEEKNAEIEGLEQRLEKLEQQMNHQNGGAK